MVIIASGIARGHIHMVAMVMVTTEMATMLQLIG